MPTKPGHVRLIVRNHLCARKLPLGARLMGLMPQWVHHMKAADVSDGDSVILVRQVGPFPGRPASDAQRFLQCCRAALTLLVLIAGGLAMHGSHSVSDT